MKHSRTDTIVYAVSAAVLAALFITQIHKQVAEGKTHSKYAHLYHKMSRSVVKLQPTGSNGGGTGFHVTLPNGTVGILSNWHVCLAAVDGVMRATSEDGEITFVDVVRSSSKVDLCLLKSKGLAPIPISTTDVKTYDTVHTAGYPGLGTKNAVPATGDVIGPKAVEIPLPPFRDASCPGDLPAVDYLGMFGEKIRFCMLRMMVVDTTATIAPGASGSPVVNNQGELVGVINSTNGIANHGAMVPLASVKAFLAEEL
jgi:S1-C subfamily serine protease